MEGDFPSGQEAIERHDSALADRLSGGLDRRHLQLLSPESGDPRRSTLIFVSHRDRTRNRGLHDALKANGIDVAFRAGALRLSPHLYNSSGDVDRALAVLNETAAAH